MDPLALRKLVDGLRHSERTLHRGLAALKAQDATIKAVRVPGSCSSPPTSCPRWSSTPRGRRQILGLQSVQGREDPAFARVARRPDRKLAAGVPPMLIVAPVLSCLVATPTSISWLIAHVVLK
jgi:hypothetical protein